MKLAFAFLWLVRLLPMPLIHALAWLIGRLAYYLVAPRRKVGLINMQLCFPEWPRTRHKQIIKGCFVNMARMLLEYGICWYSSAERIRRLMPIKNLHYLTDLRDAGEDVLVLYPHFTAFEMGAFCLNQYLPLVSVYSHQKNTVLDTQLYQGRMRFNNTRLISRQESLRTIIRAMRDGHMPFMYLGDQDFGPRDSLFVKFFATDAATVTGLSRIARLANAKVVSIIARRVGFHFELECYPQWENFPTDDVHADTRRMNAFLEERILEHPEQYYWLHKRFKTRPEGEARFY